MRSKAEYVFTTKGMKTTKGRLFKLLNFVNFVVRISYSEFAHLRVIAFNSLSQRSRSFRTAPLSVRAPDAIF